MESWQVLLVVVLVLGLITLIGHGIWAFLALLIRGGSRKVPPASPPVPSQVPHVVRVCNNCHNVIPAYRPTCPNCPTRPTAIDEAGDLESVRAQVRRLFDEGLLDGDVVARVSSAIDQRQQYLAAKRAAAAEPAMPAPTEAPDVPLAQFAPPPPVRGMPPPLPVRPLPVEPVEPAAAEPFVQPVPATEQEYAGVAQEQSFHYPPPIPARPPAPPHRPLAEVLASFMEQKNIRWGELVGGLLIVGCSVALVLSFWAEIAQRPYLKFSIFTAVTGALFGLGLYTEHKWKLPTTSRGMLLIATLLVPLNFLAFAAFSRSAPASNVIAIAGEAVALVLFLWLLHAAARVIAPEWPWLLTAGVLSLSAASLAVRYGLPAFGVASPVALFALAAPAFVCYAAPVGGMLAKARRRTPLDGDAGEAVLLFLGVVTFAAIFPFALLVVKSGDALEAARRLAPLIALGGVPPLAAGLLLWRRVEGDAAAKLRTAGAAVAVMGVGIMLAAVALAWPHPAAMLPVAVADCVALTALAVAFRVRAGHLLAAACAFLAYLIGYHVLRGHVGWTSEGGTLGRALLLPGGGTALVGLTLLMLAASEGFRRLARAADARAWLLAATVTAGVSSVLVATGGLGRTGDPYYATWAYAIYTAAAFVVAWRWRLAAAGWAAWALLLVATAQGFASHGAEVEGTTLGLLAYATAAAVVAFAARRGGPDAARLFAAPARAALLVTSAVLVLFLAGGVATGDLGAVALRATWLAALWLAVAIAEGSAAWFAAGQLAAAAAVTVAVFWRLRSRPWFQPAHPLADPWTWQSVCVALALLGGAWGLIRLLIVRRTPPPLPPPPAEGEAPAPPAIDWLAPARTLGARTWTVDRVTSLALGVGLLGLAAFAALPGVTAEFAPPAAAQAFEPTASAMHAAGVGSWLLLLTLLAGLAMLYAEGFRAVALQGAMIVAWAACALVAAKAGAAAGSAMRWMTAGYLVLGALACGAAGRSRVLPFGGPDWGEFWRGARQVLLVLGIGPVVVLSLFPTASALVGEPIAGPPAGSVFALIGPGLSYGVPLLVVAGLFALAAVRARSSGYALAALLATVLMVSSIYVVGAVTPARPMDWSHAVRLVQLNAAATSAFALAWMATLAIDARRRRTTPARPVAVTASVAVALAAVAVLVLPAMAGLFFSPTRPGAFTAEVGGMWGWIALGLSAAAAAYLASARRDRLSLSAVGVVLTVVAAMVAFAALPWETGNWVAFHTWMAAQTAAAFAMLGLGWWLHRVGRGVVLTPEIPQTAAPVLPQQSGPDAGATLESQTDPAASAAPVAPVTLEYERTDDSARLADVPVAPATVYVGGQDVRQTAAAWAGMLGAAAVFLSLRAILNDPAAPSWSVGTTVLIGLLTTAVAAWLSAPGYLYGSALLFNLAATLFAVRSPWRTGSHPLVTLLQINTIALALPAVAWLVMERQVFARLRGASRPTGWPPVHRLAAVLSAIAVMMVPVFGLVADVDGSVLRVSGLLTWAALGSAAALMAACLWDRGARHVPAGLYAIGLAGMATAVDTLNLPPPRIAWAGALLLAGYGLLTGGILRALAGRTIDRPAGDGATPPLPGQDVRIWLVPANVALSLVVLLAAFWVDFSFAERTDRLLVACAALTQVAAIGLIARGERGTALRQWALLVGAAAALALGWAFPTPKAFDPGARYTLAHRCSIAVGVLNGVAILYGVVMRRIVPRADVWVYAGRRIALPVAAAALAAMVLTLAAEAPHYQEMKLVRMHPAAIGVVLAAFFAWCGVVLYWALVPRRDPLQLPESGRIGYVYAAEALAALGYLHVKLTLPPILPPLFNRFWPIILMIVAFLGVGLGEVFRRRGQRVLYEPLERTGAFLPLLIVLAFWFAPSEANYSGVLLAAGAVYAAAAVLRRSFAFGLLAALAGNGALWYLLHHTERFGFLAHPQLWIIPAALSVLAAGELNKSVLSAAHLRTLRYACLVGIYISSTADIFISGAAQSPWLPMVLAGLSVAGVLVGVTFRIRSFLFLGTGFLTLSLVAMIWNAAENLQWTWLWYVAGIVLGLLIILMFALFEKKRTEMLALVEGLRAWE